MAGSIRVAGHTIAEHDIVNDKVDIKNATLGSSVVGSIQGFELYQLSSDITSNTDISGFTLKTSAPFGVKGDLIEESNGIITFNSTGVYLFQGSFYITRSVADNDNVAVFTLTSTDGSTFQSLSSPQHRDQASVNANGPANNKIPIFTIVNCTDTSLVKLKFQTSSVSSGTTLQGGIYSTIIVMKIG